MIKSSARPSGLPRPVFKGSASPPQRGTVIGHGCCRNGSSCTAQGATQPASLQVSYISYQQVLSPIDLTMVISTISHTHSGGLEHCLFPHIFKMSSSQLTFICFRGVGSTTNQIHRLSIDYPYIYPDIIHLLPI